MAWATFGNRPVLISNLIRIFMRFSTYFGASSYIERHLPYYIIHIFYIGVWILVFGDTISRYIGDTSKYH